MRSSDFVLVDTDAWSHLFALKDRDHERLETWRRLLTGRRVAIATQTLAEIMTWMRVRALGSRRTTQIQSQLRANPVIPVDQAVVDQYVELTAVCLRSGNGLGDRSHVGDRWIAATAIALAVPLLSADRVFRSAPGLALLDVGEADDD